jgi:nicotinate-nucleotide pyrophosphorylase (carboxylating)
LEPRLPAPKIVDDQAIRLIDLALAEDCGTGDWTTRWTVAARARATAEIVSKATGILAGIAPATAVYQRLDPRVELDIFIADGEPVDPGDVICRLNGPARALLTGERVALNFLQRLSGVATLTRQFVEAVEGTGAKILDTRKTTPGWRGLEKAAVRAGGGQNHRTGLYDAVLIKDNHVAAAGGLAEAVERVREQNNRKLPVIVEVHSLDELDTALDADVDRILLDNLGLAELTEAVRRAGRRASRPALEASGNMTLDRVRQVAEAGVDFISVGALTHSAPALDMSMRIVKP